ncbi:Acylglycerol kinase mitochondrial [Dissostichus eleginoides]|uniref:Acylglycerol kinase mitochondrial n=1 Tax=Dissostichus eleginoides TaxID=100907 RepID=A0AAD9BNL0_DISEL|nr:Acylglycerol kinase mitochondrial [Dissostichus eleginoides]
MGEKAMDLASERKKNGWTHVESAGCHGGLLSEGHRQYMKHDGAKLDFRRVKGSWSEVKGGTCLGRWLYGEHGASFVHCAL